MQINPGALYGKRDETKEESWRAMQDSNPRLSIFKPKQAIIKPITLPTELIARSFASGRYYP